MLKVDSNKIKVLLQYRCMSAADLAKATGLSANSICAIINAKSTPRAKTLQKICNALDFEAKDLLQDPEQNQ